MTGIVEKTLDSIGTLLSPLGSNVGLKYMFERCLAARTKGEEELLVRDSLRMVQSKLSDPHCKPVLITKCLAFVVFAEMLGYKAQFAYIHAVKLAQCGSLLEKKMGYLACSFLLCDSDPLAVLLVNTILRDLTSRNLLAVAMALSACCGLVPPDQVPTVLPVVAERLRHQSELIRAKAAAVVRHLASRCLHQCHLYSGSVRRLLGDPDPGVVAAALQSLLGMAQVAPDVVTGLGPSLVHIQQQILDGRLPREYTHHGLSAPWTQLTILHLLRCKGVTERPEAVPAVRRTLEVVAAQRGGWMGPCLEKEAACTLAWLCDECDDVVLSTVNRLLASELSNLRHTGLQLLEDMVLVRPGLTLFPEQRSIVLAGLEQDDSCLRRAALSLLCASANNPRLAEAACIRVADYMQSCHNSHLCSTLVKRALMLTDAYADDSDHWHLAALVRLLPVAPIEQAEQVHEMLKKALLTEGARKARPKVLHILSKCAELRTAPATVLEVYVWALARFQGGDIAQKLLLTLGWKVLPHEPRGPVRGLLWALVEALQHLAWNDGQFAVTPELEEFTAKLGKSCKCDAPLREACDELLRTWPHLKDIRALPPHVESTLDCTLSFLDGYVCNSLREGAIPYVPRTEVTSVQLPDLRPRSPSVASDDTSTSTSWVITSWQPTHELATGAVWTPDGRLLSSPTPQQSPTGDGELFEESARPRDALEELLAEDLSKLALPGAEHS